MGSDQPLTRNAPRWTSDHVGAGNPKAHAINIAACALVAAKVYEAFQWVAFHGPRGKGSYEDPSCYHVPEAEEIAALLTSMRDEALARKEEDHTAQIGRLRFLAYADDDGPDSTVDFYISLGSQW